MGLQTNDHGALVFMNGVNEIPSNHQTPMLTVWRRLHVEVDSMSAVTNNQVTGTVTKMQGNNNGVTNVVLSVNLKTGLTPADSSVNLSSFPPENGRFENGWIAIGNNTNSGLLGNGDNFVRIPSGGTVKFDLIRSNGSNGVAGQVINMVPINNSYQFTVNRTLSNNAYAGGTLTVAGTAFNVMGNTANTVLTGSGNIPFTLHDDDDDTVLPHSPVISSVMVGAYQAAYITPILDGGGNTNWNTVNVSYVANVNLAAIANIMTSSHALESSGNRAQDFWCAYVLTAHQFSTSPEQVGPVGVGNPPRADLDPNSETDLTALNSQPYGTILFWECVHETGTSSSEEQIVSHEVAHQFGALDSYINGSSPADDIMGGGLYSPGSRFYPEALNDLRKRVNSPNSP